MPRLMLFQRYQRQFAFDPTVVGSDLQRPVLPGVRGLCDQGKDITRRRIRQFPIC
jgi:hypothetical protein